MGAWVIQAALLAKCFDTVVVSTDSEVIADVVKQISSDVVVLSPAHEHATDEASTESVMLDVMTRVDFEMLITVQATSPLLTSTDKEVSDTGKAVLVDAFRAIAQSETSLARLQELRGSC